MILSATVAAALGYAWNQGTGLAWLTLGGVYTLLLIIADGIWHLLAAVRRRWRRLLLRIAVLGATSAIGGLAPVAVGQIESRFADEEFFVFAQVLTLALLSGLMLGIHLYLSARPGRMDAVEHRRGLRLDVRWILVGLTFLTAGAWCEPPTPSR